MVMRVNADLFRLAYGAVSTEETRYYLNGVRVEPHPERGALLVSTDGHRMICIHDVGADCDESAIIQLPKFALPLCAAKRGKSLGLDRTVLDIDVKEGRATLVNETVGKDGAVTKSKPQITAHNVVIEGAYPDWRKVTPKGVMEPAGLSAFNPKYLASLGQFGQSLSPGFSKGAMYFLQPKDATPGGPIVVRFSGVSHIFAVLMPMRADPELSLPSFFDTPVPQAIAA